MVIINYIEGLTCAWKSLLTKALEKEWEKVQHELWRVLNKSDFPGDWKNLEEIFKIDRRFIEQEQKRGINWQEKEKIFFDRSFLTHLTYAYAYSKHTKIPSFEWTIRLYQEAIEYKKLIIPDTIVDIIISSENSIKRQENKIQANPQKALPTFWRDKFFLNNILYAYTKLYEAYNWLVIQLDSNLSTSEKLNKVLNFWIQKGRNLKLDLEDYLSKLK